MAHCDTTTMEQVLVKKHTNGFFIAKNIFSGGWAGPGGIVAQIWPLNSLRRV
jgi:hypothetical protein